MEPAVFNAYCFRYDKIFEFSALSQSPIIISFCLALDMATFNLLGSLRIFGILLSFKVNENKFGCPAVGSLNNRMYEINCMFDIEIEFGFRDNKPYYEYKYPVDIYKDVPDVHNVINNQINTSETDKDTLTLQVLTDHIFVTDNKELEIVILPSLDNVEVENCRYISGTFKPYGWLRNFNASWMLLDNNKPGLVKLSMNKSMTTFLFNMPVNLKVREPTKEILDYHKYMYKIVN